ncbi:MAG: PP2C family protein-serine/threonine phosphatase [Balneolaceae bacterium]
MLTRNSYILLALGIIGLSAFFFLRQAIDYNASGALSDTRTQVEHEYKDLARQLGFSMDSLSVATTFQQHFRYFDQLNDSLVNKISPSELNERGAHTRSWASIIGREKSYSSPFISSQGVFDAVGTLSLRTSNSGKLIRLNSNPDLPNPTFVQGDSIEAAAAKVVGDILGYNLDDYILTEEKLVDTLLVANEGQLASTLLEEENDSESTEISISWQRRPGATLGPQTLSISLTPVVRDFETSTGFSTRFGYSINNFSAKNDREPEELSIASQNSIDVLQITLFASALVLTILIFVVGIRNVFKGKVEWRRAMFIFVSITLVIFGWRLIYFWSTYASFFDGTGVFVNILNTLLFALVVGLYGAMSYISWEAFARAHKNGQVELMDAFWQRRFFVRETGAALIHGFSIGGILLGIFAASIYLKDTYFLQTDSQFGFAEASIRPKILTINMTAWSNTWLIGFAEIGFVYGFCKQWIKNSWGVLLVSILVTTLCITVLGRVVATPLGLGEDLLIFFGIGVAVVLAYEKFGIITANTAWWFFVCTILVMPYLGSDSIEIASVSWVQGALVLGFLSFGFISYRYGMPVSEVGDYIPEYQERIAQHLRVEKEIEIARESQYKLMPTHPPTAEGIDVYGFFLPSFEVGGDYFDYLLSKDEDGNPLALTMTVVDVSGKAMRAAMPAIFTSGLLLSRMKEDSPSKILSDVSEPIFLRTDKRTFITCAMAQYDLNSRIISVVNAGHCKPIIKRNGVADFVQTPEPRYPLGLKPDTKYESQDFKLKKGDLFLLYSDGLPEASNAAGERFGFEEVPRLLERIDTENLSSQEIAQEIKRTVQKFSNYQLADDTTVICLKV